MSTDSWPGAYGVDRPFGPPADPPKDVIEIVRYGVPIGKGRVRFVRKTGIAFTPERTRSFEGELRQLAHMAMGGAPPIEGPVSVHIEASFPVPISWSKAKRARAIAGEEIHQSRPDVDNICKLLDALNQIVWLDDKQIALCLISKHFAERPRLLIKVTRV